MDINRRAFLQSSLATTGALALKQMSGDSTMVKNYPERYKGVLATAYLDGVQAHTQPYFYALFIRFNDAATL